MDKVYQIFVSSTYADLADERRRVSETLAKAGYIPAGMELFPAADQRQLEFIKRVIDRSDYYVVIVGGRYGWCRLCREPGATRRQRHWLYRF